MSRASGHDGSHGRWLLCLGCLQYKPGRLVFQGFRTVSPSFYQLPQAEREAASKKDQGRCQCQFLRRRHTSGLKWFYILYCDSNMCDPFCKDFMTVAESQSIVYYAHIMCIFWESPIVRTIFYRGVQPSDRAFWGGRSVLTSGADTWNRQECLQKNNNDITYAWILEKQRVFNKDVTGCIWLQCIWGKYWKTDIPGPKVERIAN